MDLAKKQQRGVTRYRNGSKARRRGVFFTYSIPYRFLYLNAGLSNTEMKTAAWQHQFIPLEVTPSVQMGREALFAEFVFDNGSRLMQHWNSAILFLFYR